MIDSFWNEQHRRYLEKGWIDRPTVFAQYVVGQRLLPKSGTLLDLGGGQGQDARFFANQGLDVTLADGSDQALELARHKADDRGIPLQIVKADLSEPLTFEPESFDVVWSHLSLHYFDEETTRRRFAEIAAILRPGGLLALMVNSADDPEIPLLETISSDYYLEPKTGFRKRYFTPQSLQAFLPTDFVTILLDAKGETHKDPHSTLIRYIGRKRDNCDTVRLIGGLMAKKKDVTLDDLAGMIQRGFEGERQERGTELKALRQETADGFKAVRKEMKAGFAKNDREHALIRKEMKAGFAKNDREHETMMDDILWLKRELADIRLKIHGLSDKKIATALLKRVDRIEAHLGFASPVTLS